MPFKTVVYKDADGLYSYAHLNADGDPWIHSADEPCKAKDAAKTAAQLAFPAWPVEFVDADPWVAQAVSAVEGEDEK